MSGPSSAAAGPPASNASPVAPRRRHLFHERRTRIPTLARARVGHGPRRAARLACETRMAKINANYQKLQAGYLFSEIAKRVRAFSEQNPSARVIRLGIGDVVLPLPAPIVEALKAAADEMASKESFKGYGPEQGYDFLLKAVADHFVSQGAQVAADEVFVSDGSKCDTANIQEIFATDNVVAVTDPVYPVYVDSSVMTGRTGTADAQGRFGGLVYLP